MEMKPTEHRTHTCGCDISYTLCLHFYYFQWKTFWGSNLQTSLHLKILPDTFNDYKYAWKDIFVRLWATSGFIFPPASLSHCEEVGFPELVPTLMQHILIKTEYTRTYFSCLHDFILFLSSRVTKVNFTNPWNFLRCVRKKTGFSNTIYFCVQTVKQNLCLWFHYNNLQD